MRSHTLAYISAIILLSCSAFAGSLARIYIVPQDISLMTTAQQQYKVIGEDFDGNEVSIPTPVTWSADPNAGSITANGLFTAGNVFSKYRGGITASAGGFTASANVEVLHNSQQSGYVLERSLGSIDAGWYDSPRDIAFGRDGNLYMIDDQTNSISKFDSSGQLISRSSLGYTVDDSQRLAIDSTGCIYILYPNENCVRKFSASGTLITQWGSQGADNDQFDTPVDIVVDSTDRIYVSERTNNRIQVFNSAGEFIASWPISVYYPGYPYTIASIAIDSNDLVYAWVTSSWLSGDKIWILNTQGNLLSRHYFYHHQYNDVQFVVNNIGCDILFNNTVYGYNHDECYYNYYGAKETVAFGHFGHELGQFDDASGIAVGSDGNIYVSDHGNCRINIYDPNGNYLSSWYSAGNRKGQLKYPAGISVDAQNNLYIADSGNYRVQKFDANGGFIQEYASKRGKDSAYCCPGGVAVDSSGNVFITDAIFNRVCTYDSSDTLIQANVMPASSNDKTASPMGITRSVNGSFYVTDPGLSCIRTLDSSGNCISSWGVEGTATGQLKSPSGITVDSTGYLLIADYGNNRIQKFNASGMFIGKWGTTGTGNGQFQGPTGICVDSSNNVYVADQSNCRVQVFNKTSAYLKQLGSNGYGNFGFQYPEGVAVDTQGNLYVADTYNHRVLKYVKAQTLSVNITSPTADPTYTTSSLTINVGGTASNSASTVTWTTSNGQSGTCTGTMNWILPSIPLVPGRNVITIKAADSSGNTVQDSLTITCTASVVTITSPTSDACYMTNISTINLSGTAKTPNSISTVTWKNSRGGNGNCAGGVSWSASGVTLYSGLNAITVTATDTGGGTGEDTLWVYYISGNPMSISDAKALPDSNDIYLTNKTVTAIFADAVYIEEYDRHSGIMVRPYSPIGNITVGSIVNVGGNLDTISGERSIYGIITTGN